MSTEREIVRFEPPERGNAFWERVFSSNDFQERVNTGFKKALEQEAQGEPNPPSPTFSVLVRTGGIVYSPLYPSDVAAATPIMSPQWRINFREESSKFKVAATFRFLSIDRPNPFTNRDIQNHELAMHRSNYPALPDQWEGVFTPRLNESNEIRSVTLFMYASPATASDEHLTAKFNTLFLEEQVLLLKNSGFCVIVFDLPIENESVNLNPLRAAFQSK